MIQFTIHAWHEFDVSLHDMTLDVSLHGCVFTDVSWCFGIFHVVSGIIELSLPGVCVCWSNQLQYLIRGWVDE